MPANQYDPGYIKIHIKLQGHKHSYGRVIYGLPRTPICHMTEHWYKFALN